MDAHERFADTTTRHVDDQGRLHNVAGPAVIYVDGISEWWIEGERVRPF